MIIQIKNEFRRITEDVLGNTFSSLSISELEDFSQNYDFSKPLCNLAPIIEIEDNKMISGAIRHNFRLKLQFLTKFAKSNHKEDTKDLLIDTMIEFSQNWFRQLDKNEQLFWIQPFWQWKLTVLRQHTSNLLCGVQADVFIDAACNTVPATTLGFDYVLDNAMN